MKYKPASEQKMDYLAEIAVRKPKQKKFKPVIYIGDRVQVTGSGEGRCTPRGVGGVISGSQFLRLSRQAIEFNGEGVVLDFNQFNDGPTYRIKDNLGREFDVGARYLDRISQDARNKRLERIVKARARRLEPHYIL